MFPKNPVHSEGESNMNDDCVFCQIISGDIPSYDVYETDEVLAFLDANPVAKGHTLVIPKTHRERLTDLTGDETAAVFNAARVIAKSFETALEPDGYNVYQTNGEAAGQEVFHSHVHVVPRNHDDDITPGFEPGDLEESTARKLQQLLRETV